MMLKEKKNFIWNFVGSLVFGFTSLFFMMILTRVNGIDDAGIFTYCFATACILYAVASFSGKTFQITDISDKYTDTDYIYSRVFTYIIAIISSILFALITKCSMDKTIVLILLTLYRGLDAVIESFHAVTQKKGDLYKVGISLFFRAISVVLVFFISNYLTHNLILSCFLIFCVGVLFLLFYDIPSAKVGLVKVKFSWKNNVSLLKEGTYTFLFSFLTIYLLNAPRYALELLNQNSLQAIYGIIIMPASFLSLVASYIIQPFLTKISEYVKDSDTKKLNSFLLKISGIVIVCGIICMIGVYFLGEFVLEILYGINLVNQNLNLVIIILASIFYSLSILFSAVLIAMRKTLSQLIVLILDTILTIGVCYFLITNYELRGASIAYLFIMFFQFLIYGILIYRYTHLKRGCITLRLAGGLGNQMFEYSALRSKMLDNNFEGVISLKGITNKTHNVYSLDYFNISDDVKVIENESLKSKIDHLIYGFYCVFLIKRKNGFKIMKNVQPLLNFFGIYCVPDGYIELKNSNSTNQVMVGYFQSLKYFDKHRDILRRELQVNIPVLPRNIEILDKIKNSNSVCVHIRRGDYVGSNHQVCTIDYYLKAIEEIKLRVKKPQFFIFSDDIKWVKENVDFGVDVVYIEGNNPNYEELRLMYSCKHFIISNSSFSWWAQYLTENNDRITVAPSKWFQNQNQRVDIYEDDWVIIDV